MDEARRTTEWAEDAVTYQPTIGGRGKGRWWWRSHRLTGGKTASSRGGREREAAARQEAKAEMEAKARLKTMTMRLVSVTVDTMTTVAVAVDDYGDG